MSRRPRLVTPLILAGTCAIGCTADSSAAALFTLGAQSYQVDHIAGSGAGRAILALDFGTNAEPLPVLFGYQWDPAAAPSPSGRTLLVNLQAAGTGLTFTDTYFASFDSWMLNTLWYGALQPADNWPDSFWFWFTSPDGQLWSDSQSGYDQTTLADGSFYAWALQRDDPNFGRDFSLPPLPPSHFPAPVIPVPEPASLCVLAVGLVGALRRW